MLSHRERLELGKSRFTELLKSLEARSVLSAEEVEMHIETMICDGGAMTPFDMVLSYCVRNRVQLTEAELHLCALLYEDMIGYVDEPYEDMLAVQKKKL